MNPLKALLCWLRSLVTARAAKREIDEELQFHLEQRIAENVAAGMSPAEAAQAARKRFGNVQSVREECRETAGANFGETLRQDVLFGLRMLRKNPGFTTVAVLMLALGIGANTAIFSLLDAVMLKKLPVAEPSALYLFGTGRAAGSTGSFPDRSWALYSYPMFRTLRSQNQVFAEVGAVKSLLMGVYGRAEGSSALEKVQVQLVSGSYFPLLGVKPLLGRALTDADDEKPGGHPVVVLSHGLWSERYGRDAAIIGKTLTLGSTAYTVVGVTPPEFFGTTVGQAPDVWIPLAMEAQVSPGWTGLQDNFFQSLYLLGRLKPGVGAVEAQANINVVFQQLLRDYSGARPSEQALKDIAKARIDLTPAATGLSRLRNQFSKPLQILMVVAALVLVIACANLAGLMLARANGRHREIAVRMAMGAGRGRLIRQLLTESLLLAVGGGLLGVLLAKWSSHLLVAMVSSGPQPALAVALDARILGFTVVISVLTAVLFGIAPALRATGIEFGKTLKAGRGAGAGRTRSPLARALIAGQVALSFALLAGASLFLRSLVNLANLDTGFDKNHVLMVQVDASAAGYKADARLVNLQQQIEERLTALPGVRAASFAFFIFNQGGWTTEIGTPAAAAMPPDDRVVNHNVVGTGYFAAMGIPLLQGRAFDSQDTANAPKVAIVNETLARKFFPNESALGRRFRLEGPNASADNDREIVGIVKDTKYENLRETPRPIAFYPHPQRIQFLGNLVVRYEGERSAIVLAVKRAVGEIDATVPLSDITTLEERVNRSMVDQKLIAQLSSFFGVLAVFLACVGIYGLMSYAVGQRTSEIGIRMALGAQPGGILWLMLRETLVLVAVGVVVGLPIFLMTQGFIASQLYGLKPTDPVSITAAAVAMLLVAALASYLPSRRASKVDPMVALRHE